MTETEQFLQEMTGRISDAEVALHNGDPGPRIAMWSRTDPLTLFGAGMKGTRWEALRGVFEVLGSQFSNCLSYEHEVLAAEARGDLAYIVGLEHTTASINGAPPKPYVLRVTTIFRREDDGWKVVHRHGDPLPADGGADASALAPLSGNPSS